jgi:hypothetical protein
MAASATRPLRRGAWSGRRPRAPDGRFFGIFFGPYLAGVTCVAVGNGTAGAFVPRQYGISSPELATLVRGACVHWAPPGTNSKLVAWTVRLLRRTDPHAKILLAYADSEAGEIGTIYQACGWTYIGPGSTVVEWVSPSGRVVNTRAMGSSGASRGWAPTRGRNRTRRTEEALLAAGWRKQRSNPKHRYVAVVDTADAELSSRVRAMALPYPKRELAPAGQGGEGDSDDALGFQSREDPSKGSRRST